MVDPVEEHGLKVKEALLIFCWKRATEDEQEDPMT